MPVTELLLVSPPDYETREFRGAQPLGLAYLAASLREFGPLPCQILDANLHGPMPLAQLVDQVLNFVRGVKEAGGHPILGISAVSQVVYTAVELAAQVKAVHADVLVIMGGYHPTFAHQEVLRDFPAIDLCVRGEGEETLLEIMQYWQAVRGRSLGSIDWGHILGLTWRRGDEVVTNLSRPNRPDLDAVPFPARELLPPLEAYAPYADTVAGTMRVKASIMSSRGCPFHCNFCAIISFYGDAGGKPWRGRSVENVVAEMVELKERFGASHFEFQDDNFFVRPDRALAIVEAFARTGHDYSFAFLTRADQIVRGERYFPALRQAGLRYVSVGIESGSEASLERMVKQTTVAANRRALEILHENDVAAQVEFIMFEPQSTLEDLALNLQFIEEQGLFGYFPPLILGNLLLMPGTPVRAQMERELGVAGNIHEVLPYRFSDPWVTEIKNLLGEFQSRMGNAWFGLAFELLDGIPAQEIRLRQEGAARVNGSPNPQALLRQMAQLKLEFFALTRIPYALLRSAIRSAQAGEPIPVEALLQRAEVELREVRGRVRELLGATAPAGG